MLHETTRPDVDKFGTAQIVYMSFINMTQFMQIQILAVWVSLPTYGTQANGTNYIGTMDQASGAGVTLNNGMGSRDKMRQQV